MAGLGRMVETYRTTPQYGDPAQFQTELERVTRSTQQQESQLYSLTCQLHQLQLQLPPCSDNQSNTTDTASQSSGYPSSATSIYMQIAFPHCRSEHSTN